MNKLNTILKRKFFKVTIIMLITTFSLTMHESFASDNGNESNTMRLKLVNNEYNFLQSNNAFSYIYSDSLHMVLKTAVDSLKKVDFKNLVNKVNQQKKMKSTNKNDNNYGNTTGDYILQGIIGASIVVGVILIALSGFSGTFRVF